jgi:phosphohistidine phosphatase
MRHGEAVDEAPPLGDRGRWLTARGRAQTRRVAQLIKDTIEPTMQPAVVWTSPLVRAVQTADIVVEYLKRPDEIQVVSDLSIDGNPRAVAQLLRTHASADPILVVGHEPSLTNLAVILMGAAWRGFAKSEVLAITLDHDKKSGKKIFVLSP